MPQHFKHLDKANGWPGLGTVDPFALQITFDPYLWTPDVEIHLCQNRLDQGYRNVVGWASAAERDAWYDAHSDRSYRLDSELHVLPGQEVKLPIPFEVLNNYNQLWIEFPPQPTEYGSTTPYRIYYFISDISYRAPSTTACVVTLDEWTTHAVEMDMPYIRLERGHAPMAAVSVSDYLADPMGHSELLSVQDDSYGDIERLRHEAIAMISSTDVWCVLALSASIWEDPNAIGSEEWHCPYSHRLMTQGAPSIQTVAVEPADLPTLLENIETIAPQLMPTIQACYVVAKAWVDLGYHREAYGVEVWEIGATQRLQTLIDLEPSMFGYDERYSSIAKLYTSPYASIELTDQTGASQRIRVEDTTGQLQLSVAAALTWPALGIDAYVIGIGQDGSHSMSWSTFAQHSASAGGFWTQTLRHFAIPCFMITADPKRQYAYMQYYSIQQAEEQNQAAYDMAHRVAQDSYDMQLAGLARQAARLVQQQTNDTAQKTIQQAADTAILHLETQKAMDDRDADALMMSQTEIANLNAISLSQSQALAANGIAQQSATVAQGVAMANERSVQAAVDYSQQTADAQFNTSIFGLMENYTRATAEMQAFDMGGGSKMADMMMAGYGEDVAQKEAMGVALFDKIGGALNTITGGESAPIVGTVGAMGGMTHSQHESITTSNQASIAAASGSVQQAQLTLQGAQLTAQNIHATYAMQAGATAAMTQASQTCSMQKTFYATQLAEDVLDETHDMQDSSLAQQQATQTAISNGDIALGQSNAAITKAIADDSADMNKRLQDASILRGYRAAQLSSPRAVTSAALNSAMSTRPQFLAARVVTQSPAAIAAAGDNFLKHGYRLAGREWKIDTLTPMPVFSYWRGDIQIAQYNNNAGTYEAIHAIFAAGVTIWKDPAKIGSTSIYENRLEV